MNCSRCKIGTINLSKIDGLHKCCYNCNLIYSDIFEDYELKIDNDHSIYWDLPDLCFYNGNQIDFIPIDLDIERIKKLLVLL
jgi:hypothetical protein